LIGEIGLGKSLLARRLLESLPDSEYEISLLVVLHEDVDSLWLLKRIAAQVGIVDCPEDKVEIMTRLLHRLQELAAENGINIIITPRTIEIPDSVFYHCYPADLGALIEALLWANANEIYHSANRAQNQNSVFGQLVKILVRHYSSSQIDRCLKPFKNQWLKVILVTAINQCQLELVKQQEWLDGQCRLEQLAKQTETNLKQVRKLSRFSSLSRYLIAKTFGLQPKTKFSQLIPVVQLPPHQSVTPQEVAELTGAKPKAEISAA